MQILYLRLSISRMNEIRLNYVQRFVNTFEDIILQIDSKILIYRRIKVVDIFNTQFQNCFYNRLEWNVKF